MKDKRCSTCEHEISRFRCAVKDCGFYSKWKPKEETNDPTVHPTMMEVFKTIGEG